MLNIFNGNELDLTTRNEDIPEISIEDELKHLASFRNGGEGMIKWCNENIRVPIQYGDSGAETYVYLGEMPDKKHPITGRSFKYFWQKQQETLYDALEMHNGHFKHRLIIFCEPRGDGKSYRAMLIQCWKFFCFPRQMIVLGANSKEQTKFVHFDIIRKMILNSPKLIEQLGKKNVQEKELRMKNSRNEVVSFVRPISTMQGIVSNISGYTFSEMFKMTNTVFFTELHGSIRNIPNALGVIDSTVSPKSHKLYQLYEAWKEKKSPTLFFCYRSSKNGKQEDYWHPNQTQQQLDSYEIEFGSDDFARFFKNTWEAGQGSIITPGMIASMNIAGIDGKLVSGQEIVHVLNKIEDAKNTLEERHIKNDHSMDRMLENKIRFINMRLNPLDKIYSFYENGRIKRCTNEELVTLGELYNTGWVIGAGVDRADPLKEINDGANTIVTVTAKGLLNSNSLDPASLLAKDKNPLYLYALLDFRLVPSSDIEDIKEFLLDNVEEYDGIDDLCSERWGMWDIGKWCEANDIKFEPVFPSYSLQRDVFRTFFSVMKNGQLKAPPVPFAGVKGGDLLREELDVFHHSLDSKYFGSPEKKRRGGIQDDSVFSLGYSIYATRERTIMDLRNRIKSAVFAKYYAK